VNFTGAVTRGALCGGDAHDCGWRATLHTPVLDLRHVVSAFQPAGGNRFFDFFRSNASGGWPVFQINLNADALSISGTATPLTIAHAVVDMTASGSDLKLVRCGGTALGGTLECSGDIALDRSATQLGLGIARANLAAAGALFHERWGAGTAEASINLVLRNGGATGDFTSTLRDVSLAGAPPASALGHADLWQMAGHISGNALTLDRSTLSSGANNVPVTGTISFDRRLDLTMAPANAPQSRVGGTVAAPVAQ
jgi:hypothetical protein